MTESRGIYDARQDVTVDADKFAQLQQSAAEAEAERIRNLPRDELIYQVDGETDSQQELIERLAEMVVESREQVRELEFILAKCRDNASKDAKYLAGNVAEARSWARALLARSENLEWLVGRDSGILERRMSGSWRRN